MKSKTTPLVSQYQKEQAALNWLLERARSLAEATGLTLNDMGSWLMYNAFKDGEINGIHRIAVDRKSTQEERVSALTRTPEEATEDELELCEDERGVLAWVTDIMDAVKWDGDADKPLVKPPVKEHAKKGDKDANKVRNAPHPFKGARRGATFCICGMSKDSVVHKVRS